MNCSICRRAGKLALEKYGYRIYDCATCAHRYLAAIENPQQHLKSIYGDEYFNSGGAGYADYLSEAEILRAHGRRYGKLLMRHAPQGGNLLDVGAAAGFILEGLTTNEKWRGQGIEPNATMTAKAIERGLHISVGSLESFIDGEKFNAVTMIQVAAHFYDVRAAFENAARLLEPDGLLLVETWNWRSLTARLLKDNWHEYSPPSVVQWFSPQSLQILVEQTGLQKIARGRPAKRLSAAHAKSLLSHKAGESRLNALLRVGLKIIPDNAALPYPAEDLFWMLFKK